MPAGIIFIVSSSLAADEAIYNRTSQSCLSKQRRHLKIDDVLSLEVSVTIRILEFLFIAFSQNGSLVISWIIYEWMGNSTRHKVRNKAFDDFAWLSQWLE